jgi:hypothetical protein
LNAAKRVTVPRPNALVYGEFTADSHRDLAMTSDQDDSLVILNGNGSGMVTVGQVIQTGHGPKSLLAADLDNDGLSDLLVANSEDDTIGAFLQKAPGEYAGQILQSAGDGPVSLGVGDLNGDGNRDLIVGSLNTELGASSLSVLIGNGDGTFGQASNYPSSGQRTMVEVGDLNGDGDLDVALTNDSPILEIWYGNGTGTLEPGPTIDAGQTPTGLAVADLNGDAKQDLVVAIERMGSLTVLLSQGQGAFTSTQQPTDGIPYDVVVSDLNSDLVPDLLVNVGAGVQILTGKGDGTFGLGRIYAGEDGNTAMTVGDLDGDGRPDLAMGGASIGQPSGSVDTLLNDGAGALLGNELHDSSAHQIYVAMQLRDVTGDAKLDLVAIGSCGPEVAVFRGDGAGAFANNAVIVSASEPNQCGSHPVAPMEIGDFDRDGLDDIVVQNYSTAVTEVRHNDGNLQFSTSTTLPLTSLTGMAAADLNRDGYLDLAAVQGPANRLNVMINDGAGGFLAPLQYATGEWPTKVAIAAMDGDDWLDLVVANYVDRTIGVYKGQETGGFAPPTLYDAGLKPLYLRVADVNHDAQPDVVAVDRDASSFSVLLNSANGILAQPLVGRTGTSPEDFSVDDFDGDGDLDLAIPEQYDGGLTLYFGKGDGSFAVGPTYGGGECMAAASGDANRDGRPDLIAGWLGAKMSVYINRGRCE